MMDKSQYDLAQEKAKEIVKNEIERLNSFVELLGEIHYNFQHRDVSDEVHTKWFNSYRDNIIQGLNETCSNIDVDLWNLGCEHFGIDREYDA